MKETQRALAGCLEGRSLTREEAREAMREIMRGEAPEPLIAAYLIALRMKGETAAEIAGSAEAMREVAVRITPPTPDVVDTCGTGGDGLHTLNISTGAAIVAASAGCTVAKHGNRAVSSRCGSADVLEALGVDVAAPPATVEKCLRDVGVGFLFAPSLHAAMRHAVPVRRALGIRTVFNVLGPLTNPAGATRQVVGVFARSWVERMAEVQGLLGARHAVIVHGADGMDEITLTGPTWVAEWRDGGVRSHTLEPGTFGLERVPADSLAGGDAERNAAALTAILQGKDRSPARDVVLVNAGAALYVGGRAADWRDGYERAREALERGAAWATLEKLRDASREEP